jgi:SOS-response transcriptional repressor LexA
MAERSTKRQKELLDFVDAFIQEHGYGPSYREIMNGIGYKSVSTVAIHIEGLITKGFLRKTDNSARSLEVVTKNPSNAVAVAHTTVSPAREKWLVEEVNARFAVYDTNPNRVTLDELYVLIGTLKILGMDAAHESMKEKLAKIR